MLIQIEQSKVANIIQHLDWKGENPGHVNAGLPWEHQPYKDRLDKLEKAQKLGVEVLDEEGFQDLIKDL